MAAGKVRLETPRGKKMASCGKKLGARGTGTIRVENQGIYRGNLVARPAAGSLNVINTVGLEGYLRGVVPDETPAPGPIDALRAQAVAARCFALATGVSGDGFSPTTTPAARSTAASRRGRGDDQAVGDDDGEGRHVRRQGRETFFKSTSGGRTENIEYVFGGVQSRPYRESVDDRGDAISPYHRWKHTFSRAELQSRLGDWVEGRLRGVRRGRDRRLAADRPRSSSAPAADGNGQRPTCGPGSGCADLGEFKRR